MGIDDNLKTVENKKLNTASEFSASEGNMEIVQKA